MLEKGRLHPLCSQLRQMGNSGLEWRRTTSPSVTAPAHTKGDIPQGVKAYYLDNP